MRMKSCGFCTVVSVSLMLQGFFFFDVVSYGAKHKPPWASAAKAAGSPHASDPGVTISVRPTDVDGKGHVNNARYVEYFQAARWEWLADKGLTDARIKELGAVLVVANVSVDYRREINYGDRIGVTTKILKVGEKSFTVSQAVIKNDGSTAAEGTVVLVSIDPSTRKSRPLPAELRDAVSGD